MEGNQADRYSPDHWGQETKMIFFKAAIYKQNKLQEIIESISIEDAEKLLIEGPAKGLQINVGAFLPDGRHLQGFYEEMGATIYAQPFCARTAPNKDEDEIADAVSTLHSIIPQYRANQAYISAPLP